MNFNKLYLVLFHESIEYVLFLWLHENFKICMGYDTVKFPKMS